MNIVCLDMEGVLVPEIWIAFAEKVGIPEFKRTTRDEPDFDKLMHFREMIRASKAGFLFRSTDAIKAANPDLQAFETYEDFYNAIVEAL